jgi:hypothetical protein
MIINHINPLLREHLSPSTPEERAEIEAFEEFVNVIVLLPKEDISRAVRRVGDLIFNEKLNEQEKKELGAYNRLVIAILNRAISELK